MFMNFCFKSLILSLFGNCLTHGGQTEKRFTIRIILGYNKFIRPVNNFNDTLDVTIGLAVQNIESFNQIEETIQLNVWLRKYWRMVL